MPTVTFDKENKVVTCSSGENLRKLALNNGIDLYSGIWKLLNCRGNGLCGKCEVEIPVGAGLSGRTVMEEFQLKGKPAIRRLACQVVVHGNLIVRSGPAK